MNARDFAKQRALIERRYTHAKQRRKAMEGLARRAGAAMVILGDKSVGYRLQTGEMVCVKERFKSALLAHQAIERIGSEPNSGHRVPKRFYACQHCFGWHVTSQAARHLEAA